MRVFYVTHDVTSYIVPGVNAIGVITGRGWYTQEGMGQPCFTMQMSINATDAQDNDQSFWLSSADNSWTTALGPIVENDIYNGETYDARLETPGWDEPGFNDSTWKTPTVSPGPLGALTSMQIPPVEVIMELPAVSVKQPQPGIYVVDFGRHLSGHCRLTVLAPTTPGVTVVLQHAEILQADGSGMIYTAELRSAKATDTYITKGSSANEIYEPRFTYHGFRYVQITGLPYAPDLSTLVAVHVRSSVNQKGWVDFSLPALNQVQSLVYWSQATNLMSVPTDCDNRDERKGWMGDAALTADEAYHNFDMPAFYTSFLDLIQDEQPLDPANSVPDTVPYTWGGRQGDPAWMSAYPTILYGMYRYYGDTRVVQQHMDSIGAMLFSLAGIAKQNLANLYSPYGDWVNNDCIRAVPFNAMCK